LGVANRRQKPARGSFLKVLIPPGKSGNVLATIAIGEQYLQPFMKYAYHTWEMYCRRHDLGLILFDDHLIAKSDQNWKNPYWQKFLIGDYLLKQKLGIRSVCCLDTDILISPLAPNIFENRDETKVGLVSLRKNLAYPYEGSLRRMAFLRNRYFDQKYPLDSSLFVSIDGLYEMIGLDAQDDEACSGVFVFNCELHGLNMSNFYNSFDKSVMDRDGGGEQIFLNHFVQSKGLVEWLEYRFQAMWTYEMANKYPFLYKEKDQDQDLSLIKKCIEASLFTNYFLHFAGSWHEGKMWEQVKVFDTPESLEMFSVFSEYMKTPVYGKPLGAIKPKENS
jgi:hypothetical protein